jgi:hypothetical protein
VQPLAEVAEAAAVAMARADNNQQRAAKTVAAAISVARGARHEERSGGGSGGGGSSDGRWGEKPAVRVEIGVPRTLLGDYLAQSTVMFLVNAYMESSQCLTSRQTFICATDRFICSRR